jgi:4,5-dihydroxyphthalate decarboxylase
MTPLTAAIGRYAHTEALCADPLLRIEPFPAISRAFAPMVREQRFDVSEMAIATLLMARAAGSDLVLLPVVLAARFQNGAMLRRAADRFGPGDLRGRRIGVRAYSQTTGLWLRGILQEEYGLRAGDVRWVTFEDAHVAAYRDPAWTERAAAGSDMLAMLRGGELDAAIFGNDTPAAADLATVFEDPAAAGRSFQQRHGLMPVNHMVVVRAEVARREGVARSLMQRFGAAGNPFPLGRKALDPAVALAIRYAAEQGLLARPLTLDEVWAGLPPDIAAMEPQSAAGA